MMRSSVYLALSLYMAASTARSIPGQHHVARDAQAGTSQYFDFTALHQHYQPISYSASNSTTSETAFCTTMDEECNSKYSSDYFETGDFADLFVTSNYHVDANEDNPVQRKNSRSNVYIGGDSTTTWLELRTAREADFQSVAELQSKTKYQRVSLRMKARVVGDPGSCSSLFTYENDAQEGDIEILNWQDPSEINLTNQPGRSGSTILTTASSGVNWSEWGIYEYKLTDSTEVPSNGTVSTWYFNDKQIGEMAWNAPREASYVMLQNWGSGGEWSGKMKVGGASYFQVQWLKIDVLE